MNGLPKWIPVLSAVAGLATGAAVAGYDAATRLAEFAGRADMERLSQHLEGRLGKIDTRLALIELRLHLPVSPPEPEAAK